MSKASRMASAALALAVWLGAGASFAADENWDSTLMKPTQAKSLDVGTKRKVRELFRQRRRRLPAYRDDRGESRGAVRGRRGAAAACGRARQDGADRHS